MQVTKERLFNAKWITPWNPFLETSTHSTLEWWEILLWSPASFSEPLDCFYLTLTYIHILRPKEKLFKNHKIMDICWLEAIRTQGREEKAIMKILPQNRTSLTFPAYLLLSASWSLCHSLSLSTCSRFPFHVKKARRKHRCFCILLLFT